MFLLWKERTRGKEMQNSMGEDHKEDIAKKEVKNKFMSMVNLLNFLISLLQFVMLEQMNICSILCFHFGEILVLLTLPQPTTWHL